jgi:hypothetical protein
MTDAPPSHPWKRHRRAGLRQRLPWLTDPAERVVVVAAPAWSPAPPLGTAHAIRLAAITKLGDERWPWVRRA